jgi:hypothetical protein
MLVGCSPAGAATFFSPLEIEVRAALHVESVKGEPAGSDIFSVVPAKVSVSSPTSQHEALMTGGIGRRVNARPART